MTEKERGMSVAKEKEMGKANEKDKGGLKRKSLIDDPRFPERGRLWLLTKRPPRTRKLK